MAHRVVTVPWGSMLVRGALPSVRSAREAISRTLQERLCVMRVHLARLVVGLEERFALIAVLGRIVWKGRRAARPARAARRLVLRQDFALLVLQARWVLSVVPPVLLERSPHKDRTPVLPAQ